MATEEQLSVQRLQQLKHIVVVMMENRSFDHMLGYLWGEGMTDVDGLRGTEFNRGPDGRKIPVHAFDAEAATVQREGEALEKRLDPDHSPAGVKIQLGPGYKDEGIHNGGFVESFVKSRKEKIDRKLQAVPMGYYTSKDVPVYDHLARQYCVCDRWFASIPGDTWPNRIYATTGTYKKPVTKTDPFWKFVAKLPFGKQLAGMPLYDIKAFTRELGDDQWRWYSHDPGTLRLVDSTYRDLTDPMQDNFSFFDKRKVSAFTRAIESPIVRGDSFLDDVANNRLPRVSWIDPNFVDLSVRDPNSNDDHPPSDIRAGQAFVFDVYEALLRSKNWDDTLLVITYDEHGGFYDHVSPPLVPKGDGSGYDTYGVRVPALIVGPRVRRSVLHEPQHALPGVQFDHTTLIKTILRATVKNSDAAVAAMPVRVQRAPHLGEVLLDAPRTDIDDPRNARDLMDSWRLEARRRRAALPADAKTSAAEGAGTSSVAPDGAGQPFVLTDFQEEWQQFALAMKAAGVHA